MISARYAWAVAALLVVALVPTAIHVYGAPAPLQAGGIDQLLPAQLEGFSEPQGGGRSARWTMGEFGTRDFASRRYPDFDADNGLELFAARAWDGKKLFHFPETALVRSGDKTDERMIEIRVAGEPVPARLLEFTASDGHILALYVLFYGKRPVARPVRFQMALVPELMFGTREPLTLIFVRADATETSRAVVETRLHNLLAAAATAFLSAR